jgi:predicted nuclease with TOPRIM domain
MREKLEERLNVLKSEYEAGQKMLAELEEKRANITQTMLRIQGAMQVLQEMIDQESSPAMGEGENGPMRRSS